MCNNVTLVTLTVIGCSKVCRLGVEKKISDRIEGREGGGVEGGIDWKPHYIFKRKHGKDCWFARSLKINEKRVDCNLSTGSKVKSILGWKVYLKVNKQCLKHYAFIVVLQIKPKYRTLRWDLNT